jgi:hypothetical protein
LNYLYLEKTCTLITLMASAESPNRSGVKRNRRDDHHDRFAESPLLNDSSSSSSSSSFNSPIHEHSMNSFTEKEPKRKCTFNIDDDKYNSPERFFAYPSNPNIKSPFRSPNYSSGSSPVVVEVQKREIEKKIEDGEKWNEFRLNRIPEFNLNLGGPNSSERRYIEPVVLSAEHETCDEREES